MIIIIWSICHGLWDVLLFSSAAASVHTLPHILQSTPASFSLRNASHTDACQPIGCQPPLSAAHLWLVAPLNPVSCSHFFFTFLINAIIPALSKVRRKLWLPINRMKYFLPFGNTSWIFGNTWVLFFFYRVSKICQCVICSKPECVIPLLCDIKKMSEYITLYYPK